MSTHNTGVVSITPINWNKFNMYMLTSEQKQKLMMKINSKPVEDISHQPIQENDTNKKEESIQENDTNKEEEEPIQENDTNKKEEESIQETIIQPTKNILYNYSINDTTDPLFWSIYYINYGKDSYDFNYYNFGKIKVDEMQKIVKFINEIGWKSICNRLEIKLTKKQYELMLERLMINRKIDISSMYALSIYYDRPIRLIIPKKNVFYLFNKLSNNKPINLIIQTNKYLFNNNKNNNGGDNEDDSIFDNYHKIINYDKPLLSISNYTVDELVLIYNNTLFKYNNISIDKSNKKIIKSNLYDALKIFLSFDYDPI